MPDKVHKDFYFIRDKNIFNSISCQNVCETIAVGEKCNF